MRTCAIIHPVHLELEPALPFLMINSSRMCGIRQTGYCSTMVVSTQAEGHVHHTDLFN
jgi:hypothetical protein